MQGIIALAICAFIVFGFNDVKERIQQIDDYHISRVNQANRRIAELEDKIRDLEHEVNWK